MKAKQLAEKLDELNFETGGLTNNIQLLRISIDELTKELRSRRLEQIAEEKKKKTRK